MRDQYRITITSFEGSHHYTLTQLMRRFLAATAAVLGVLFVGGFISIYFLSSELYSLKKFQDQIKNENIALLAEQERLQASVEEKAAALSVMGEELDSIELMMGLKPGAEDELYERLDTASQTVQEKRYMLTSIPSGYPLEETKVTSFFGMRKHPVLGKMKLHGGADLRAAIGTPVFATADGVVEWAGMHESGLGRMVKLSHNFGFSTVYGHLDKTTISVGDYVRQGDVIGYSGNTGLSSAPHLHYEVRHLHRRLAPRAFMEWSLENYDVLFTKEERIKWDSLAKALKKQMALPERRWSQLAPALPATSS